MNQIYKNKLYFTISATLRSISMLCATGPLMQTFIEVSGFGSSFNYLHTSIIQVVNILVILLFSHFADTHAISKRSAITIIPMGLLFLFYIPLCFLHKVSTFAMTLLLGTAIIQTVFAALYTVCDYKLPYHIFIPEDYGVVLATTGILSSAFSLGFSSLISYFSSIYDYKTVMLVSFILSAFLTVVSGILFFYIKSLIIAPANQKDEKGEKVSVAKMFLHPVFYKLFIPNLLRGFAFGTTTVLTIVAFTLGYNEKVATVMVTIQSAAFFLGSGLFGFLSKYVKMRHLLIVPALFFVFMPLLLIKSTSVFLTVYALLMCARTITDNAVPAVLLRAVPIEIAGPYNAWRMVIHTAGILIATSLAAILSPTVLIWSTTVLYMLFAIIYVSIKEIKNAV